MVTDTEKLAQIERIVQEWTDQQGHDRCWYYPDLYRRIIDVLGIEPKLALGLPPRPEFERGCKRYQDEEYGKGTG